MRSINKITKESGINFAGSSIGNLLGYIWLMLMTRFLSQEDFGSFTLAQSIVNISLIFVLFGTHRSLDRFIPFYTASGTPGKIKALLLGIFRFSIISNLIVCLVISIGADQLAKYLFNDPILSDILRIIVFSIPLLSVIMIITNAFAGYKELRYHVYLKQMIEPGLKILFVLLLAVLGLSVIEWSYLYLIALILTVIFGTWFLFTRILKPLSDIPIIPIDLKEIIAYSWPISIASVLIIIVGQIDYLILGIYYSVVNISVYRIYIQIVVILRLILGSMARIYKPVISELIPQGDYKEITDTYRRVSKWVLLFTTLGFLIVLLYGERITKLLFTDAYAIFPQALSILALGTFLHSAYGPVGMTLEAFGNTKLVLVNSLVMVLMNVGLGFLLIPGYGIVGAAIATTATLSISGLIGLIEIYILYKMQPFSIDSLKFVGLGLLCWGIFYGIDQLLVAEGLLPVLLMIIILSFVYSGGLFLTNSLDRIDRNILNEIIFRILPNNIQI